MEIIQQKFSLKLLTTSFLALTHLVNNLMLPKSTHETRATLITIKMPEKFRETQSQGTPRCKFKRSQIKRPDISPRNVHCKIPYIKYPFQLNLLNWDVVFFL